LGESFEFEVDGADARAAFHHPYVDANLDVDGTLTTVRE